MCRIRSAAAVPERLAPPEMRARAPTRWLKPARRLSVPLKTFKRLLPERQGRNLAWTVSHVPNSLDSGRSRTPGSTSRAGTHTGTSSARCGALDTPSTSDSYMNKRIDTPGILLTNLFRQCYGKMKQVARAGTHTDTSCARCGALTRAQHALNLNIWEYNPI